MRIIEPQQLQSKKHRRVPVKPMLVSVAILAGLLVTGFVFFGRNNNKSNGISKVLSSQKTAAQSTAETGPKKLRIYTGEEFKQLYNNFAYPNVVEVTSPPVISGNDAADKRLQMLAEQRGYKLRSGPATALEKVDGFPLQQKAHQPWLDMKAAAAHEGINLAIVSGFRSVDEQRVLFLQRLAAAGATIGQVAGGQADAAVVSVLETSSLPGYSRHHTGYTFDLMCNGQDFNFFANTPCFAWLSKNNYENAKKFGWIPSYPPGTGIQGPNEEAWEYVLGRNRRALSIDKGVNSKFQNPNS